MDIVSCHTRHCRTVSAFSLIELSIVVAIISVVSALGLEAAANFAVRTAGNLTKERLAALDDATDRFFKIYGRLPCPAILTTPPSDITYGREDCTNIGALPGNNVGVNIGTTATNYGGGAYVGAVPFRTLGLPLAYAIDGFENKINYVVTKNLTVAGGTSALAASYVADKFASFATDQPTWTQHFGTAGIEVRSGILDTNCDGTSLNCQKVADPAAGSGAAYFIFSSGADRRGAYSAKGVLRLACIPGGTAAYYNTRVDTQNCQRGTTTATSPNMPTANIFYDNKYNAGLNLTRYFDDYVIWRTKGQL